MPLCLSLAAALVLLSACKPQGPVAIDYGAEFGEFCTMMITDQRYGAELITDTGKHYTFDSIECLIGFTITGPVEADHIDSLWVTDFANPGTLIPAEDAYYLQSGSLRSPMAVNLTAFASHNDLETIKVDHDGLEIVFADLANVVRASGFLGREEAEHAHEAPLHEGER
jgi:copper chaperone NosL